ncbi:hypothetical protein LRX75_21600 [Rhizobium sp. DKSPLA3]|uniref:Uncharacterized protein n=1 Tax=Rhizobium quercicola TaxID=2901226 RepID=A0A9X1NXA2_9HYPH|nr:hypothetical protein [Rhizobium quercicola]MCD7111631.1 hypothetical protein [Rhizobium quercicola]
MGTSEHNGTSEQKRPNDIRPTADNAVADEKDAVAPTFVKPADEKDAGDRPVVNPVTGGAF